MFDLFTFYYNYIRDMVNTHETWQKMATTKVAPTHGVISSGMIPDWQAVVKFGYNPDVDSTADESVWSSGGIWQPATSAEVIDISSSSAQDTNVSGTGAWLMAIFGLDDDFNEISELTIALNGTSTVQTTNSYRVINRCAVAYSGSNGTNVGDITFTQTSSGLQLAEIPAEYSVTQKAIYTVPAGYTGYLQGLYVNTGKTSGGGSPSVNFKVISYNDASKTNYTVLEAINDVVSGNHISIDQPFASPTAEKNTLYVNVGSDTNNVRVFARMYILLIKN